MHELSICQALLDEVAQLAREREAQRVLSVTVRIGPLSGVEPGLLESAYPMASAGTLAAGSKLIIERSALRVRCRECGTECEVESTRVLCTQCGHWRVQVLSGEELLLVRVELEKENG
jgi:hydrogenase nickel incorporation protein HypA/HybF